MGPLLAVLAVAATAPVSTAPAADAAGVIEKVWASTVRSCGNSAFYETGARILELDHPTFRVADTKLTEAAKQSGYEHQATAVATARRWRWAPRTAAGAGRWSDWREGANVDVRLDNFGIGKDHALLQDAVLQFDVVRRKGHWSAFRPLSPINSTPEMIDPDAAPAASTPACARLTARR